MILETDRLTLREMTQEDFTPLCKILQDKEVMYAYEHAFSDEEVHNWLDKQLNSYKEYGFGLWAAVLKGSGEVIGQCGLTMQDCNGKKVLEVGYLLRKEFWHNGYAIEAAGAVKRYAFDKLNAGEVYSIIRQNNLPSQRVAIKNGMTIKDKLTRHYYGIDMPHFVYCVKSGDKD